MQYAEPWVLVVELDDPSARVVVGHAPDGELVGIASAGPPREAAVAGWEVYVVNVTDPFRGTGLADELMAAVAGDRAAYLWVVADNARARAFYARHGFAPDGGTRRDEATAAELLRLTRSAGPARSGTVVVMSADDPKAAVERDGEVAVDQGG